MAQHRDPIANDGKEMSVSIDLEKCRLLGRSPEVMLAQRCCAECQASLDRTAELPRAETQLREIARCCSKKEDFITTEMPLLEIAFRTLLTLRNRPISLRDLHHQVTEEWATPSNPKSISVEGFKNILLRDTYYCFALSSTEPGSTA
jgi:hypothetical protein